MNIIRQVVDTTKTILHQLCACVFFLQGHVFSSEIERWEDENNAIVRVAKETTYLVENMSLYVKGSGTLQVIMIQTF